MSGWQVRPPKGRESPECGHLAGLPVQVESAGQCEECVRDGSSWVHLRRCLACGHVGCCESSPRRHATQHWQSSRHPVVASAEPGEHWAWCYADEALLVPAP